VIHTSPPMGPSYGGPFQSVRKLAQAQMACGIDVAVRMPWSKEAGAHHADWDPVPSSISGKILLPMLGWSPEYARDLLSCEADILHTHGLWQHPSWAALAWKKRYKRPHVCSVRGMLEPWAWQHHAWKKRPVWWLWEKRNLQSADLLHATSDQEAQALRDRGLTAPIAIIPNGVDVPEEDVGGDCDGRADRPRSAHLSPAGQNANDHAVSSRPRGESRTSEAACPYLHRTQTQPTNLSSSAPRTALFLSRIHPKKGLPMLLEAWARVRPKGWQLHIAGPDEGGHRAELERQAVVLGLSDVVRFSGPVTGEAKTQAFRDSQLFILPTHSENFGIAVAEALAHGLPVITTHGAPWKLLESERCGWWVPVSVDGIADALDDATRCDPADLISMGDRGRQVAIDRFAWDRIARLFGESYQRLLGGGDWPSCFVQ